MRFISVFNGFVTAGAVNAAGNSTVATEITNALKHGDFVGAAMDILTLGDCDLANVAECAAGFAPLAIDCGMAIAMKGGNVSDNLNCLKDGLTAVGGSDLAKCVSCLEEGVSIALSLVGSV